MKKHLTKIDAYTVNSSDDEYRSSNKGVYRNYTTAFNKTEGAGWYGAKGEVENIEVWQDNEGNLYTLKHLGRGFTDEIQKQEEDMLSNIKSKLNNEELEFLKLK